MPLSALSESLAFHKSPESFISLRLADLARTDPSQLPSSSSSPKVIRASILNRNVHIISDHDACRQVLSSSGPFQAIPAYNDLMAPFFPPPNLLLADGAKHAEWKDRWRRQVNNMPSTITPMPSSISARFVDGIFKSGSTVDIYDAMKTLAWQLLFSTFLMQHSHQPNINDERILVETEHLQESLLRGQFSMFPVSIKTPFWSSARSRGITARIHLQKLLKEHFISLQHTSKDTRRDNGSCPLLKGEEITDIDDIANHALLFTSGLANKALASLLTFSILNVFLYSPSGSVSSDNPNQSATLASLLRSMPPDSPERAKMLSSILLETERLSPPVVGVLRRATEPCFLYPGRGDQDVDRGQGEHAIPKGHEAWLYFPSASRSTATFGDDAETFRWDRFMHTQSEDNPAQQSFAFGAGPKTCLGQDISRKIVEVVISILLDAGLDMEETPGHEPEPGVQAMLGWCTVDQAGVVEVMARDLKQLPTQRPRRPVLVTVTKNI